MINCKLREGLEKWIVSHTASSPKNAVTCLRIICKIFHQKCLYSLTQTFYL